MALFSKFVLRHRRSRLLSLWNRLTLRGPRATAFNFRGMAVPLDTLDLFGEDQVAVQSGRFKERDVTRLWQVVKSADIGSALICADDHGILTLYAALRVFPKERVTAVYRSPADFAAACKLLRRMAVPFASTRLGKPDDAAQIVREGERVAVIYAPARLWGSTLPALPGDLLLFDIKYALDQVDALVPFAGRKVIMLKPPWPPKKPPPIPNVQPLYINWRPERPTDDPPETAVQPFYLTLRPDRRIPRSRYPRPLPIELQFDFRDSPRYLAEIRARSLDRLSRILANNGFFVDTRLSQRDMIVARAWRQRWEWY